MWPWPSSAPHRPVTLEVRAEGTGRGELAELVAYHGLRTINGYVLAPVVNGDGMADELGVDHARPAPRLEHPLFVVLVHPEDALHKALLHERLFLRGPRHLAPPSFPAPADDHGVRALVLLPRRGALGDLAPRRNRGPARRALPLAATVRVVDGVHDRTAHRRPYPEVALAASFAPAHVLVRLVADDANRGPALGPYPAALAAGEPERHEVTLAGRQLGARPRAAGQLRPAARLELDGVHDGTDGYPVEGKRVAHVHLGIWPALDDGADREVARREDVALLAVVVVQEGDVGRTVRVVLDRRDRGGDTVLAPLEVDETIGGLVSAADVAGGYAAVVVAPARLVQLGGQLLLGNVLRDRVARQNRGVSEARAGRPVTSRRHTRPPRISLCARPRR